MMTNIDSNKIEEKKSLLKDKIKQGLDYIKLHFPRLKNKYVVTVLIYVIWVSFFDENSLISDLRYKSEIKDLQNKIENYREDIAKSISKSNELRSNNENLEKFAREQYKMKKAKEDIYVVE